MGAGVYTTVYASDLRDGINRSVGSDSIVHGVSKKHYEYIGFGLIGVGILLATVWSDVEVNRLAEISIGPNGSIMASRSFVW